MGEAGQKAVWAVPQAFGGAEYVLIRMQTDLLQTHLDRHWSRAPTGQEFLLQAVLALNHGAVAITPWIWPTTEDIARSATALACAMTEHIAPFLSDPKKEMSTIRWNRVDICMWRVLDRTLIMGVNMNEHQIIIPALEIRGEYQTVINSGMTVQLGDSSSRGLYAFGALGVGIYISYPIHSGHTS